MNTLRSAIKACRPFFRLLATPLGATARAISRTAKQSVPAFESALETIAHVLCVESRGSVAHLAEHASSARR
jgi:hypothetical protein